MATSCEICGACGCGTRLQTVSTEKGDYIVCSNCVNRALNGEEKKYPAGSNVVSGNGGNTGGNSTNPQIFIKSIKWQ
jgi:ribosome-binding protein aMBF1 (putative translation factor)